MSGDIKTKVKINKDDIDMTDEHNESVADDEKDQSHSHLRKTKKGRKFNKEHSSNVEPSAPNETKDDTEEFSKKKKGREHDIRKGKKNKGDKKDLHGTSSMADETTLNEDTRNKLDEPKKEAQKSLTVEQLIEKYQGKHQEKERKH